MPSQVKRLSSLFGSAVKLKHATSSPGTVLTSSTTSKPKSPTFLSKKTSHKSAGHDKLPTLISELNSDYGICLGLFESVQIFSFNVENAWLDIYELSC